MTSPTARLHKPTAPISGLSVTSGDGRLLPQCARFLRRRTFPAAVEPGLDLRPFRQVEEKRAIECAGDVEIADRELGAGKPLRLRKRGFQHVERLGHFLPHSSGDFWIAFCFRQLFRMPNVVHELTIETIGFPETPLERERFVFGIRWI